MVELAPTQDESAALTADKIQAILAGPDYFTCERMHARIKKADCVERQKGIWVPGMPRWWKETPPECQGCEQGKDITQGAESATVLWRAQSETKEGEMKKTCKEPGCDKPVVSREMCRKHYDRWRNQWWRDHKKRQEDNKNKICSEEGCSKPAKVKGMCKPCYDKKWRKDHPPKGVERPSGIPYRGSPVANSTGQAESRALKEELLFGQHVVLNFEEYPDLLEQLKAQAQEEFRSLELQSLYLLKKGLEENEA